MTMKVEVTIQSDTSLSVTSQVIQERSPDVADKVEGNVNLLPNAELPEDLDESLQEIVQVFIRSLHGAGFNSVTGVGVEIDGGDVQWSQ